MLSCYVQYQEVVRRVFPENVTKIKIASMTGFFLIFLENWFLPINGICTQNDFFHISVEQLYEQDKAIEKNKKWGPLWKAIKWPIQIKYIFLLHENEENIKIT